MTLKMYQSYLFQINETAAHEPVISRWFHTRYSFSANFRKLNLLPIDKFKPENVQRAYDSIDTTDRPFPLKFWGPEASQGCGTL